MKSGNKLRKRPNFLLRARRQRMNTAGAPLPGWQMALFHLVILAAVAGSLGFDRFISRIVTSSDLRVFALLNEIEDFGNSKWFLVPSICWLLALILMRRYITSERRDAAAVWLIQAMAYITATVAISGITANLLKRLFGRARPRALEDHLTADWTFFAGNSHFQSFPSGHATTCLAAMVSLALLFPRFRIPFLVIGILGAVARVTVGAHFPSDIFAGGILGGLFAWWIALYFADRGWVFEPRVGNQPLRRKEPKAISTFFTGGAG